MFSCSECPDLTFERRSVCERHVFEKHSGFGYRCTGCKKTFNGPDNHQGKFIGAEMRLVKRATGTFVKRATGTFSDEKEKEYHRFMGTMAVRVNVSKTVPQSFSDRRGMQFNHRERSHSNQENRRGEKIFRTNSETKSVLGKLYSNTQEKQYEDSRRVVEIARERQNEKEQEKKKNETQRKEKGGL